MLTSTVYIKNVTKYLLKKTLPHFDLIVIVFLLIYTPVAHGAVDVLSITIIQISIIIAVFVRLLANIHEGIFRFNRTPVDIPILIFLTFACLSVFISVYPYASLLFFYKILTYTVIFYLIVNRVRYLEKIKLFVLIIVLTGSIYATAGLIVIGGNFFNFKVFSEETYNISLFFVNRNHFAGFLEMPALLCLGLILIHLKAKRYLFLSFGMIMSVAILFSLSRGGTIGLLASLIFLLIVFASLKEKLKNISLLLLYMAFILLFLFLMGWEPVLERISTLGDPIFAGMGRLAYWQGAIAMISAYPWFGTGLGTFMYAYPHFQTDYAANRIVSHAHNDYLELTGEMGVTGILIALFLIFLFYRTVLKRLFVVKDKNLQTIGFVALAACFSLLVHAFFEFNFHIPSNVILFIVCAALAVNSAGFKLPVFQFNVPGKWKYLSYIAVISLCIVLSIISLSPYFGKTYLTEAKKLQAAEEYEPAMEILKKAISVDSRNAELFASMGDLLIQKSVFEEDSTEKRKLIHQSIDYYNGSIERCPVWGDYYTKKAFALQRSGNFEEAEGAFKTAVFYSPKNAFTHYNLGTFYIKQGDKDKAFEAFKEFLNLDNRYLSLVLDQILNDKDNYDAIKFAIPEELSTRIKFAQYLLQKKFNEAAIEQFTFVFQQDPSPENALLHIRALYKAGDYNQALSQCNQYLDQFGNDMPLREQLAVIYEKIGQFEQSIDIYKQLIKEHPDVLRFYIKQANYYSKMRLYQEAIDALKDGLTFHQNNAQLFFTTGNYYREMQKFEKMFDNLKKAVFLQPNNINYRYNLATQYFQKGMYQQASEQLLKCLEIKPDDSRSIIMMNKIKEKLGILDSNKL